MKFDNIIGLQHLGLPTSCLEETVKFYKKFGFLEIGKELLPDKAHTVIFMALKETVLEVYQQNQTSEQAGAWNHIALGVENIEQAWEDVKGYEMKILEKEIQFLPFWENGVKYFNIIGPNMETIELIQRL